MEQRPVDHVRTDLENVVRHFARSLPWDVPLDPTAQRPLGVGMQQDQDGAWHAVVLEVGDIGDLTCQRYALLPPQTP
jgi:hypothetical protein